MVFGRGVTMIFARCHYKGRKKWSLVVPICNPRCSADREIARPV